MESSDSPASDSPASFVLSFEGKISGEARCVSADVDGGRFIAATTKGVVTLFSQQSPNQWDPTLLFGGEPIHGRNNGMVADIRCVKAETFVSCGSDKKALVWSTSGERLAQLVGGHAQGLTSVDPISMEQVVTGARDGTAIVWYKGRAVHRLEQHEFAVAAAFLNDGEVCTGSGSHHHGDLRTWKYGQKTDENMTAHLKIVKKIIRHPLGFVSCANDGYVKVWARGPPMICIMSCLAHPPSACDSYVYSIELLPSLELVSVGEDKFARIIAPDGKIVQSLRHPAAVWSVAVLPNGDIVTGCSDNVVRVWTRDPSRFASEDVRMQYEQLLEFTENSSVQAIDPSQIKPISVLQNPGSKPGEIAIIDLPAKGPTVFQWDADARQWIEVGTALGQNGSNNTLEGVQYDHIVDVVVTEGAPPLKLGFNVSDDPEAVARAFCARHGFAEEVYPQIVEYLQPLSNPIARIQKQEQERQNLKLIPTWKQEGYIVDSRVVVKPLEASINSTNTTLTEDAALDEEQMRVFASIISLLESFSTTKTQFTTGMAVFVQHILLHWPLDKLLPVLDLMRMLIAVHADGASICEKPEITERLLSVAKDGTAIHLALVLKIFGNWIAKRGSVAAVDSSLSIQDFLCNVVNGLSSGANNSNAAVVLAFVTLIHNILCCVGRYFKKADPSISPLLRCMAVCLASLLQHPRNEKPTYMALLATGTIAFFGESGKVVIRDVFGPGFSRISSLKASASARIRQAAQEAEKCCI